MFARVTTTQVSLDEAIHIAHEYTAQGRSRSAY